MARAPLRSAVRDLLSAELGDLRCRFSSGVSLDARSAAGVYPNRPCSRGLRWMCTCVLEHSKGGFVHLRHVVCYTLIPNGRVEISRLEMPAAHQRASKHATLATSIHSMPPLHFKKWASYASPPCFVSPCGREKKKKNQLAALLD